MMALAKTLKEGDIYAAVASDMGVPGTNTTSRRHHHRAPRPDAALAAAVVVKCVASGGSPALYQAGAETPPGRGDRSACQPSKASNHGWHRHPSRAYTGGRRSAHRRHPRRDRKSVV